MFSRIPTPTKTLSAKPKLSSSLPWLQPSVICVTIVTHPSGQRFPPSILALAQSLISVRAKMLFIGIDENWCCFRTSLTIWPFCGPKRSELKLDLKSEGIIFDGQTQRCCHSSLLETKHQRQPGFTEKQKALSVISTCLDRYENH